MMKTAVIVCSNAALDYIDHNYDIPIFRSVIIFNENEKYDDYTEIKADDFYKRLDIDKSSFPHTAFVSVGQMEKTFDELKSKGYERAFVIVISKELSSLGNTVELIAKDYEGLDIKVYNSQTIAYPEAKMALLASKMFNEGKDLNEVIAELDYIKNNNHLFFAVETLEYLIKNGRLSKFAGATANMLSIKPLLHLNKDGKVETLEKIRTSKKARSRMVELFIDDINGKDVEAFIINTNASDEVINELKTKVLENRPDLGDLKVYPLTPVVGAHAGPKTVCLGYIVNR